MRPTENQNSEQSSQKAPTSSVNLYKKIELIQSLIGLSLNHKIHTYEDLIILEILKNKHKIFPFEKIIISKNFLITCAEGVEKLEMIKDIDKLVFGKNPISRKNFISIKIKSNGSVQNHFSLNFGDYFYKSQVSQILSHMFVKQKKLNFFKFVCLIEEFAGLKDIKVTLSDLGSFTGVWKKCFEGKFKLRIGEVFLLTNCVKIKIMEIIHKKDLSLSREMSNDLKEKLTLSDLNFIEVKNNFRKVLENVSIFYTNKGPIKKNELMNLISDLFEIENKFSVIVMECENLETDLKQKMAYLTINETKCVFSHKYFPLSFLENSFFIEKCNFKDNFWKSVSIFGKNKCIPGTVELKNQDEILIDGVIFKTIILIN